MDEAVDPEVVRALYRTAPDGFVAQRDAEVRRLKQAGEKDAAAALAALRRPKVAEHALNLLSATEPLLVGRWAELVAIAEQQQAAVIAGAPATELTTALSDVRNVSNQVIDAAVRRLGDGGAAQRSAIAEALRSATSAAGSARVRAGLMGAPFEPSAEFFPGAEQVAVRPKAPPKPARGTARTIGDADVVGADTTAQRPTLRAVRDEEAERRAAQRASAKAAEEERRRTAAAAAHRRAVDRATTRVDQATARRDRAQQELDAATAELRTAQDALDTLQREG